jgi:hypothetical protein
MALDDRDVFVGLNVSEWNKTRELLLKESKLSGIAPAHRERP